MPSTYTLNNGITLIATGEQSGTWGATTNVNLELVDTALDGQVTVTLASAGSSGSPNALPISDGAASNGRNRMVIFDDGGDLGATAYVQLTPNDSEKIIYVRNALSGSRSILLFQGTYNASNDYEVPAGTTAVVYFNGGGTGAVAANVFNNAYFDGLRLGSVSVTSILDEDNMASDSATALATQQSIKAYVDSQVGTVDTLAEILANGNTTGGTDIVVSSGDVITTNTINETTAASGVTIDSLLVKDGGITAAGTSTFAGQTITNLGAVTTADINGGTIDNTVIGGSSAAAGTFTSLTANGCFIGTDPSYLYQSATDTITLRVGADGPYMTLGKDLGSSALGVGNASGALAFLTGGTNERMRITSTGNVGIGTSSPTAKVDIIETVASPTSSIWNGETLALKDDTAYAEGVGGALIFEGKYNSSGTYSTFGYIRGSKRDATDGGFRGGIVYGTRNGDHVFVTNTSGLTDGTDERMRIDSSGNVGIGTSSPDRPLTNAGNITATRGTNPWYELIETDEATTHNKVRLYMTGNDFIIQSRSNADAFVSNDYRIFRGASGPSAHAWYTGSSTERMRITSTGNVGIGTTSPAQELHVVGKARIQRSSNANLEITSDNNTGANPFLVGSNSNNFYIKNQAASGFGTGGDFIQYSESGSLRLMGTNYIDSSGNVGIGTSSPDYQLDVSGTTDPRIVLQSTGTASTDDTIFMNRVGGTTATNQIWFGDSGSASTGKLQYDHSNNAMTFHTNGGTERMRIDSSGNVGIGTSSPSTPLHVVGTVSIENSSGFATLEMGGTSGAFIDLKNPFSDDYDARLWTDGTDVYLSNKSATGSLDFRTNDTQRLRITSSGDVGIGTSSPSTLLHLASTGNAILTLEADTDNVTESDNARIELSQDGGGTTGHMGYGNNTNGIDIWNDFNDYVRIGTNNIERLRVVNNGVVRPATDNVQPLGAAANRWSVVYAGTGTINTSDEREKQQIADLDDAERRVAVAIKGLVKKYKYNDAVALKGDDARIHVGVIAQEVISTFAAEGLDATRYALLCHDTWEAEPEEVDKNGNVINPGIEAGERYGIRYDELLAFMIAAL